MNKNIITKLTEILNFYKETYRVNEPLDDVLLELLSNNVEVHGDSFFCPIWNKDLDAWILLAGSKEKADLWVLKKIIKLIKSGDKIYSMFNGNSDYLLSIFKRYNIKVMEEADGIMYISFNIKG